jgi:hypothetical protein
MIFDFLEAWGVEDKRDEMSHLANKNLFARLRHLKAQAVGLSQTSLSTASSCT